MDRDFVAKVREIHGKGDIIFSVDHNTFFVHSDSASIVQYVNEKNKKIEHQLGTIDELCEGDALFQSSDDDWTDKYLPLLMAIESAINRIQRTRSDMTDKNVIAVLERLLLKPDMKLHGYLSVAIQDHIKLTLATNSYSKKEVVGCLKKVLHSVKNHHRIGGSKGYLNFIKDKV
jgi:Mg2+ and Co2+ transporter CorA